MHNASAMETAGARLPLVRHGMTTLIAEDRFAGSMDVGRSEAEAPARRLAPERPAAVYCSPMRRTG